MLAIAMEPKDWIALSGVAATVVIAAVSLYFSSSMQRKQQQRDDALHKDQQQRDDALHKDQQQREDELRRRHREDSPHIEFSVDCQVHGRQDDEQLVEFILTAHNRGLVDWKFKSILLRVRGIEKNRSLTYWQGNEPRLEFPVKVFVAQVIPRNLNFLFVEPEVRQTITYVTKMPSRIEYILVHTEFEYDNYTPHTSERVFRLTAHGTDNLA
jgi:hypothetical protein